MTDCSSSRACLPARLKPWRWVEECYSLEATLDDYEKIHVELGGSNYETR